MPTIRPVATVIVNGRTYHAGQQYSLTSDREAELIEQVAMDVAYSSGRDMQATRYMQDSNGRSHRIPSRGEQARILGIDLASRPDMTGVMRVDSSTGETTFVDIARPVEHIELRTVLANTPELDDIDWYAEDNEPETFSNDDPEMDSLLQPYSSQVADSMHRAFNDALPGMQAFQDVLANNLLSAYRIPSHLLKEQYKDEQHIEAEARASLAKHIKDELAPLLAGLPVRCNVVLTKSSDGYRVLVGCDPINLPLLKVLVGHVCEGGMSYIDYDPGFMIHPFPKPTVGEPGVRKINLD